MGEQTWFFWYYVQRNLISTATAARRLRAIYRTPHKVRHNNKDKRMEQQACHGRQTVTGSNPAAEQATYQLERLGARKQSEGQERDDLLRGIHGAGY